MTLAAIAVHLACAFALFVLSAALTRVMIAVNIADVPNTRSSHARPTPKSGGIAIAAAYFTGLVALFLWSHAIRLEPLAFTLYVALALVLLGAGLADDLMELKPLAKLANQLAVATVFAFGVAHIERIALPGLGIVPLGGLGVVLTVLWLVGVMNIVNFMDGINGLVAGSAMLASAILAVLAAQADAPFPYLSALALLGATTGFFVFNFPGGKIFLGDTGSMLLAYVLASLGVIGATEEGGHLSAYVVPILLSPILFDGIFTLALRAWRGEKLLVAHRDHLYQRLTRAGLRHAQVAPLYFGLTLIAGGAAWLTQSVMPTQGLVVALGLLPVYGAFALGVDRFATARGA